MLIPDSAIDEIFNVQFCFGLAMDASNKWVVLTAVTVERLPEELNAEKFDSKLDEEEEAEGCLMGLVERECREEDEAENRSELQRNMNE
ncbi:hypothetical protein WR25_08154 [Diploscapter pachys]|uniref:Uncharacterized protein n=1 Tax=Diploscapter pachys TaxID=2018661 RepID=A0A2A2LSK6_9BILA|nr:hypothetical protein WR25_08154 [Diploscapter pachys]